MGFGTTMTDFDGNVVLGVVARFAARCVNPPPYMTSVVCIEAGFPGATCT
jgi:hypothetical protein